MPFAWPTFASHATTPMLWAKRSHAASSSQASRFCGAQKVVKKLFLRLRDAHWRSVFTSSSKTFFSHGGSLKSSWYGDCLPERDFPTLISLYLQGRLPLEKFVTETIALDAVEAAFEKMHRGEVLRSVVVF